MGLATNVLQLALGASSAARYGWHAGTKYVPTSTWGPAEDAEAAAEEGEAARRDGAGADDGHVDRVAAGAPRDGAFHRNGDVLLGRGRGRPQDRRCALRDMATRAGVRFPAAAATERVTSTSCHSRAAELPPSEGSPSAPVP